jgi:molybdopterin-biosynthesis enzyme MoeA-like protein
MRPRRGIPTCEVGTEIGLVTVGDEILRHEVVDENVAWVSRRLRELGRPAAWWLCVGDLPDDIADAVRFGRRRQAMVIVSGGLGGTHDDVTRMAIALAHGVPLRADPALERTIRTTTTWYDPEFAARGALLPAGARPLMSPIGGVPGFVIEQTVAMPGQPDELRAMFEAYAPAFVPGVPEATTELLVETTEDRVHGVLEECLRRHAGVRVGSYPLADGWLRVAVRGRRQADVERAAGWLADALPEQIAKTGATRC